MSALAAEYQLFRTQGGAARLVSRSKLRFTGPDALRYLNGQLTANLAGARAPAVLPACVTTAKGRLCAEVFVTLAADGTIFVDADAALAETLPARLERYIVADDVEMAEADFSLIHVLGVPAESLPPEWQARPVRRFGVAGWDVDADWETVAARFPAVSEELLEIIRIEQGVPRWGAELGEDTLPPEAGLDRTHISYQKGCYIGQEVISRLKSVGHVNRELRGFVSAADAPLAVGMRIFTADEPARDLGVLTSATHSPGLDRPIALGYLRRTAPASGLLAASAEAPDAPVALDIHPLPFLP